MAVKDSRFDKIGCWLMIFAAVSCLVGLAVWFPLIEGSTMIHDYPGCPVDLVKLDGREVRLREEYAPFYGSHTVEVRSGGQVVRSVFNAPLNGFVHVKCHPLRIELEQY
jgi:hypothetical protein